jgi:DEAD/DEAH box helicase domain-containing protein
MYSVGAMAESSVAFERRQAAPWSREYGLPSVLARWASSPAFVKNVALDVEQPATPAAYAEIPKALSPAVRYALKARQIEKVYTHQARAFELAASGQDVVVATPTASGKSLCYNLPVLDALARKSDARALYLFPTKALSRDQESSLAAFLRDAGLSHGAITFDGDTPGDARRAARDRSGVLITNPDMLHAGILPHHAGWARFFANLTHVVIDELHTYRGVFGSHLANVMRRLLRIAAFHGARPQVLFSSATIGNPAEHAKRLVGRDVALVDESGAPTGKRRVMIYNPALLDPTLGIRESYLKCAVRIAADLIRAGVSTMVFGQSRNNVEVMLKYLRDRLAPDRISRDAIVAYRGGYLPKERRRIEAALRDGSIRGVVATNALELGIDIGALDAVVCAGFPGTMAATWQRFGRGGRRSAESLAVLVTSSAPLDQFIARAPEHLVSAAIEEARVDPDNVEILVQHLKCAAFELPFEAGEGFGDVEPSSVADALTFLEEHKVVHPVPGRGGRTVYHWATDAYPANEVSLRSPSWNNFVIIDAESQHTIAEMDFRSTHTMLHEQAIYQHDGRQHQVEYLDYANHKAYVRRVEPDYYTTALTRTRVSVLDEYESAPLPEGGVIAGLGEVDVVEKVVGFKKIKFHTHENVGYGDVNLPEIEKATTAFWITIPEVILNAIEAPRAVVNEGLVGLLAVMHSVGAVGLMMDPRDVSRALVDEPGVGVDDAGKVDRRFEPTLYLYDTVPGGVGLAARLFEVRVGLLGRAARLLDACACAHGCPSCTGPMIGEVHEPHFTKKHVARRVLTLMGF